MSTTSDPHTASHLALLARLELLHASSLLRHAPTSPHANEEKEAVGQEGSFLVPEEEKESVVEGWEEIRDLSRLMGDGLREAALRLPLAHSSLPSTLADLLRLTLSLPSPLISPASFASGPSTLGAVRPEGLMAEAAVEILRAAGNSSYDCDEARSSLLAANFPQLVLVLLSSLLPTSAAGKGHRLRDANGAFRLVKTALGALMNVAMDQEDIQTALLSMEGALEIVLRTAGAIYEPTPWSFGEEANDQWATREERSTVSGWAWKVFGDVSALESAPTSLEKLAPVLLPLLMPPVLAYTPPSPPSTDVGSYPASLLVTDLSILTLAVQTLESQTLDTTAWQVALYDLDKDFTSLLDFVERAGTPAVLHDVEDEDEDEEVSSEVIEKRFGSLKGGVVKCIVAVFGEDGVGERIFQAEGAGVLERMRLWLAQEGSGEREDMVICAVLSLGNLARTEAHCDALLQAPLSLLPSLTRLLVTTTDIKVQHALVGLLKNLSVPDANKAVMSASGVMEGVTLGLGSLEDKRDMVSSVQGGAIGVVKNLCKGSPADAAKLVLPSMTHDGKCILPLILDLHRRSNDFAIRAESARVLVNAIRTLFSQKASDPAPSNEMVEAKRALSSSDEVVSVLVNLVKSGAEGGYNVLVAEGVLGLAILAGFDTETGGRIASALLAAPADDPSAKAALATSRQSPLNLLSSLLTPSQDSPKNVTISPEIKGNICTLLTAAGRGLTDVGDKKAFRNVLEQWSVKEADKGAQGLERMRTLGLRVLE